MDDLTYGNTEQEEEGKGGGSYDKQDAASDTDSSISDVSHDWHEARNDAVESGDLVRGSAPGEAHPNLDASSIYDSDVQEAADQQAEQDYMAEQDVESEDSDEDDGETDSESDSDTSSDSDGDASDAGDSDSGGDSGGDGDGGDGGDGE